MVAWNLVQSCWNREVCVHAKSTRDGHEFTKRSMFMTSIEYAKNVLFNKDYEALDVYTSLTVYDLTPMMKTTWKAKKEFLAKTKPASWIMAFDFDSHEDPIAAFPSLLGAWEWLASVYPQVKWSVKYSGSKGWHLESNMKTPYSEGIENNKMLAESFKHINKAPCVDVSIYTPRRQWRCPWSIHGSSGLVSMPFSMQELVEFVAHYPDSKRGLEPGEVLARYPIKDQGMKWMAVNEQFWQDLAKLKKAVNA